MSFFTELHLISLRYSQSYFSRFVLYFEQWLSRHLTNSISIFLVALQFDQLVDLFTRNRLARNINWNLQVILFFNTILNSISKRNIQTMLMKISVSFWSFFHSNIRHNILHFTESKPTSSKEFKC